MYYKVKIVYNMCQFKSSLKIVLKTFEIIQYDFMLLFSPFYLYLNCFKIKYLNSQIICISIVNKI